MDENLFALEVHELYQRLERLDALVLRVADENLALRHAHEQLVAERALLLAKSEQARSRVEAMIVRLRALEQNA